MKYLIYLRVSTSEQDLQTQLDHCLKFIKRKENTDFKYEVFQDKISSRKKLCDREGSKKMIESIKKGDMIIAMRLDRLSRSLHETVGFIKILDDFEADILLVEQPGITNKIMLGVYAGMAEEEVKLLRKRISEKLQSKKMRGERYSGQLPYGYAMHETHMIPIREGDKIVYKQGVLIPAPKEVEAMKLMEKCYVEHYSYQEIAKILTQRGFLNRENKPFQKMTVYRILKKIFHSTSPDLVQVQN